MPVRCKIALVVASTLIACSHGAPETTSQQNDQLVGATLETRDVAVVGLEQDGAGKSFCTATFIAPRVLLTAAH